MVRRSKRKMSFPSRDGGDSGGGGGGGDGDATPPASSRHGYNIRNRNTTNQSAIISHVLPSETANHELRVGDDGDHISTIEDDLPEQVNNNDIDLVFYQ